MKIRNFAFLFLLPILLASIIELIIVVKLNELNISIYQITNQRRNMRLLADEMRMTSEFLTRFARRYAVNKEQKVLDWYNQIIEIRDGKLARPQSYDAMYWDLVAVNIKPPPEITDKHGRSLLDLFTEVSYSTLANQKMIDAKNRSDDLARIEKISFHAMNGEFDDGTGTFQIRKKPDQQFANKILYNEAYLSAKAQIVQPIAEVQDIIYAEWKNKVEYLEEISKYLTNIQLGLTIGAIVWVVLGGAFFYLRIVNRLSKLDAAVRMVGGRFFKIKSDVTGHDEIGKIAKTLENMATDLGETFEDIENKANSLEEISQELQRERDQTEKLLYNILPAVIASRIRNGEEMIAETFPEVTVLFADIVEFTALATKLGPYETVRVLNDIFGRFDALLEKFQIEKIKTIGDCYMAVAGVPTRDPLHCQHVADFALDIINSIQEYEKDLPFSLKIRVGIHTGTVAAGIVGKRKFSYDLWGDVVNVANRFESASQPGKIHVSETVKMRLEDDYLFTEGGIIELKGKGPTKSYFLVGKKADMPHVIEFQKKH